MSLVFNPIEEEENFVTEDELVVYCDPFFTAPETITLSNKTYLDPLISGTLSAAPTENLLLNAPTGSTINLQINGTDQINIDGAKIDISGNNLTKVNTITGTNSNLRISSSAGVTLGASTTDVISVDTTKATVDKNLVINDGLTDTLLNLALRRAWLPSSNLFDNEPDAGGFTTTFTIPERIIWDGDKMWVTESFSDRVNRYSKSGRYLGGFTTGSAPVELCFDGELLYVVNSTANTVSIFDRDTGLLATLATGTTPKGVAFDGTNVWVINNSGTPSTATIIEPRTQTVLTTLSLTAVTSAHACIYAGGYMWITSTADHIVNAYGIQDPHSGTAVYTANTGLNPVAICFDGEFLWTANNVGNSVTKIQLDGTVVGSYTVTANPINLISDGTYVWVINSSSDDVDRVTIADGTVSLAHQSLPIGSDPTGICFDGTNLLCTARTTNKIHKLRL